MSIHEDTIIMPQYETQVYVNEDCAVVVKQLIRECGESDPYIVVQPENIDALVTALLNNKAAAIQVRTEDREPA
jgi:hypothetical protein